jgi:hypothetical protein
MHTIVARPGDEEGLSTMNLQSHVNKQAGIQVGGVASI